MFADSAPVLGASPPAHGRLEGRTSTRRDRRLPAQRQLSPGFPALWLSPVCFPVTIPGGDPGNKLREFVPSPGWAQDDAAVAVEGQRHTVSLTEAGLSGD